MPIEWILMSTSSPGKVSQESRMGEKCRIMAHFNEKLKDYKTTWFSSLTHLVKIEYMEHCSSSLSFPFDSSHRQSERNDSDLKRKDK